MTERASDRGSVRAPFRFADARAIWAATLLSVAVTAAVETARMPLFSHRDQLALAVGTYAIALFRVPQDLMPSVLLLPLLSLIAAWQEYGIGIRLRGRAQAFAESARRLRRIFGPLAKLVLVGLAVDAAYHKLISYPDFASYAPAWLGFCALFVAVTVIAVPGARGLEYARWPWLGAAYRWAAPIAALGGAAGCYAIDVLAFKGAYPTMHVSVLQIAQLLLPLGLWRAFYLLPERAARGPRVGAWVFAGVFYGLAAIIAELPIGDDAKPYWSAHTTLGQAEAYFRAYREPTGDGTTPVLSEARARALFRAHHGLPELPEDFDLLRYNVLLVQSEATRFDQTSLAGPGETTPELRAFHERGAYSFTRAYSPSSGTFQSTSALFGMSYPSLLNVEIWSKPWQGHYLDPLPMPAELFAAAGYDTFWVGHDLSTSFTQTMLGFDRGFARRKLLSDGRSNWIDADSLIVKLAIEELRAVSQMQKRFFGWVFFVSPHSFYDTHYRDWPGKTELEKYRQELRYLDEQLGKLLRALDELGRLDDTIVIYTGDHGEEFKEHGGWHHKGTVYTEVTRVPLVLWLPGVHGRRIDRPTSTLYLFPWLLAHGTTAMRDAVVDRLRHHIGPMLERTSGAVVSELISRDKMLTTLVYDTLKFNYDFNARLHEAYRVDRDPLEQQDLFQTDRAIGLEAERRMAGYRSVRADRNAYMFRSHQDPRGPRQ